MTPKLLAVAAAPPTAVVVASRFNEAITKRLVAGALSTLKAHGMSPARTRVIWVPGAFELPLMAAHAAKRLRPQLVVAVGCLIKGQTSQYAAIGHAVTEGLCDVSVRAGLPVGLGVIIADSVAQAKARACLPRLSAGRRQAGGHRGNRGEEAALAALTMARLLKRLT
jgi:6,7-dimethyl-8-ribityllumazine synthase